MSEDALWLALVSGLVTSLLTAGAPLLLVDIFRRAAR